MSILPLLHCLPHHLVGGASLHPHLLWDWHTMACGVPSNPHLGVLATLLEPLGVEHLACAHALVLLSLEELLGWEGFIQLGHYPLGYGAPHCRLHMLHGVDVRVPPIGAIWGVFKASKAWEKHLGPCGLMVQSGPLGLGLAHVDGLGGIRTRVGTVFDWAMAISGLVKSTI